MNTLFLNHGNDYSLTSQENLNLHDKLPPGTYTLAKRPMTGEIYILRIDSFTLPKKIYGSIHRYAERILNTFKARPNSTGVMLAGEKGSGKTLLTKTISILGAKLGLPTILINAPWHGDQFNLVVQAIQQDAIFLFDEFEKVYDEDEQQHILTLLDGVITTKKLFLFTCNNKWKIDRNMINRPGRIFYFMEFNGVDKDFICEYCQDNLHDKSHIPGLIRLHSLFENFTFDMLASTVEEMNRYNESPKQTLEMLNIKPNKEREYFEAELFLTLDDGTETKVLDNKDIYVQPFESELHLSYFLQDANHPEGGERIYTYWNPELITDIKAEEGKIFYQKDHHKLILRERHDRSLDLRRLLEY